MNNFNITQQTQTKLSQLKSRCLLALSLSLMLVTQTAHADFRKALDAYQKRDGDTLLKEVKDAVNTKNDDGLMLFLMATNMDAANSDYDESTKQSKSTLRAILPPPKWDNLRDLLTQATNNSSVDAQYYLNVENRQFSRDFMVQRLKSEQTKHGETPKKEYTNQEINQAYTDAKSNYIEKSVLPFGDYSSASIVTKQAEAGDPYAQSLIGFYSLGFYDFLVPSCKEIRSYASLCEAKNEAKGYDWLKKAVKIYEQDGLLNEGYGQLANGMCGFLLSKTNANARDLRKAYLWCFMSANLGNPFAVDLLDKMHKSGNLKEVAPQLDMVWDTPKRDEALYVKKITEWPDMVLEARQGLTPENTPVFSYFFTGVKLPTAYTLNVYSDGRVFVRDFNWRAGYRTLLTKISPRHVKQFLADLHRTGIDDWSLSSRSESLYCNEAICPLFYMSISLREGGNLRFVKITEYDEKGKDSSLKNRVRQMAKIKVVVDSYFFTKKFIPDLGNSSVRKKELLDYEKWWKDIAKQGEKK